MSEHTCDTPSFGLPGDTWTCPTCHASWWADELESDSGVYITWRKVDTPE